MELFEAKLRRLRGWFIAWFVVQSVIGTAASVRVLEVLRAWGLPGLDGGTGLARLSVVSSVFALAVLLGLVVWIFRALLQRRNWARLVLLAVGWISAAGAVTSLLSVGSLGGPAGGSRAWIWAGWRPSGS